MKPYITFWYYYHSILRSMIAIVIQLMDKIFNRRMENQLIESQNSRYKNTT